MVYHVWEGTYPSGVSWRDPLPAPVPVERFLESAAEKWPEPRDAQRRVTEMLTLMQALSAWGDEMLRLEPATLMKVMKLGARIQTLLRKAKVK